jgi:hypothetical protein
MPIRLRLRIDASGTVEGLQILQAADDDRALVAALGIQLRQTRYAPARLNGSDVPSCTDLQIDATTADLR